LADIPAAVSHLDAIRDSRSLLEEQDPVGPVLGELADRLREALRLAYAGYAAAFDQGMSALVADSTWKLLDAAAAQQILAGNQLLRQPEPVVGTPQEIAEELDSVSVTSWQDRAAALTGRFSNARAEAIQVLLPQAKRVSVPSATLSTPGDVDAYTQQLREFLLAELEAHSSIVI
jgi:hypothetical protein